MAQCVGCTVSFGQFVKALCSGRQDLFDVFKCLSWIWFERIARLIKNVNMYFWNCVRSDVDGFMTADLGNWFCYCENIDCLNIYGHLNLWSGLRKIQGLFHRSVYRIIDLDILLDTKPITVKQLINRKGVEALKSRITEEIEKMTIRI